MIEMSNYDEIFSTDEKLAKMRQEEAEGQTNKELDELRSFCSSFDINKYIRD